ncbi:helix-turn-helix domain-containing protein [Sinorhizobium fredii]|uniref:helix-turn-helix domain-containing protein n=1 Tax=Rhizobium fredii TaxID=380 RepID=UPI000595612F|nr:helix-turn-helix transcriptional regulator [Sinorhizobium fredii]WOS65231.1 LuxR C-terminal-related transcriptional regulator [Sinorhizobium fredii GR64]
MYKKAGNTRFHEELVELIYGSLLEHGKWQQFLDHLNGSMRHGKTTFMYHDAVVRKGYFSLAAGYTDEEINDYNRYYNLINPWMAKAAVRPVGKGVTSDYMFDAQQLRKTEFYNDYLRKIGLEGGAGITIFRDKGRSFVLTSLMSARDHEASADLAKLLTELSPHIARAFSYYRKGTKASDEASSQCTLLDLAGTGLILIDEDAQLKTLNKTAEQFIDQRCGLRITPTNRIVFEKTRLQEMLKDLCQRQSRGSVYRAETSNTMKSYDFTMIRMQTDKMREFLAGPSVAILIKLRSAAAEFINEFALSPGELRVARAIIGGMSVSEIALERGISRETVRTQLKSIFSKLGISSQLELVRLFQPK